MQAPTISSEARRQRINAALSAGEASASKRTAGATSLCSSAVSLFHSAPVSATAPSGSRPHARAADLPLSKASPVTTLTVTPIASHTLATRGTSAAS